MSSQFLDADRPLHVVVVARGFPTPASPLHGIFEWDQATALARAGHQVTFASLDVRSIRRRRPLGVRHLEQDGVRILDLNWPLGNVPPRLQVGVLTRAWRRALADITREIGAPDVVHAHFAPWGYAAGLAGQVRAYPLVITEHWTKLSGDSVDPALAAMATKAYRAADAVVCVSPDQAAITRTRYGVAPIVIPNMVDVAMFTPALANRTPGHSRVVSVSGLRAIKRQDALIRAVAELPGVSLRIIGDGLDRDALHALIAELGVADRVQLLGHLDRRAIAGQFADADVFALASKHETFGVVHVEAMASGLPVVTTPSGGPEPLINPATGVLVSNVGEPLVNGLRRALDADWDRAAISASVQRCSPEAVSAQLTDLYRALLGT